MDNDLGSKKKGTNTGSNTLGGSMRKGSMKQESQSLTSSMEFPHKDKEWKNKTHFR